MMCPLGQVLWDRSSRVREYRSRSNERVSSRLLKTLTFPVAGSTGATARRPDMRVFRIEEMPSHTSRLASVPGRRAFTAQDVHGKRHRLTVKRVHTVTTPTQVVKRQAVRDRAYQNFIHGQVNAASPNLSIHSNRP